MTLQDLKNNREEIINYLTSEGADVKQIMTIMSMEVIFTRHTDVIEFAKEVIWDVESTERSRKARPLAEVVSKINGTHEGLKEGYKIENHLH